MEKRQNGEPKVFPEFREYCDAVFQGDSARAEELLRRKSGSLFFGGETGKQAEFLEMLNRGLYEYVLCCRNLSLYQCCFENACVLSEWKGQPEFPVMAEKIQDCYLQQLRGSSGRNGYILRAQDYITRNLDRPLTLEQVSSRVFISKAYLSELFPECTGKSFTAYVSDCRMKLAACLLAETENPIQNVGKTCGFYSAAYFSTAFSRQYGMSPRAYRKVRQKAAVSE